MSKWAIAIAAALAPSAVLCASVAACAPAAALPTYAAAAPRGLASAEEGWGVVATVNGRAVDIDAPREQWAQDPALGPTESEAGLGWRGRRASVVAGYSAFDRTAPGGDPSLGATGIADQLRRRDSGVIGFGFALRTP